MGDETQAKGENIKVQNFRSWLFGTKITNRVVMLFRKRREKR